MSDIFSSQTQEGRFSRNVNDSNRLRLSVNRKRDFWIEIDIFVEIFRTLLDWFRALINTFTGRDFYRPHVSNILSTGGRGCLADTPILAKPPGQTAPLADIPRADTPLSRDPHGQIPPRQTPPTQTPPEQTPPPAQTQPPDRRPPQWTVRILLECILVYWKVT